MKLDTFFALLRYRFTEEYRIYHHPIYIRLCFHKLFKYWFKLRKKFVKPVWKFYKGDTAEREFDYYMESPASFQNKIFGFHIESLGYKHKWGQIRYTHCPEIVCVINKKVRFTLRLECPEDAYIYDNSRKLRKVFNTMYWESILNEYFYPEKDKVMWLYPDDNGELKNPAQEYKDRFSLGTYGGAVVEPNKIFILKPESLT